MDMFSLSYAKKLCIYFRLFLQVPPKAQNWLYKPVHFINANGLLNYVNDTMYLLVNLPFFKIHVNCFMALDDSPCANVISK